MNYEVIVVGAGPTGLWLACELALARVRVAVLEKLAKPIDPEYSHSVARVNRNGNTKSDCIAHNNKDRRTSFRPLSHPPALVAKLLRCALPDELSSASSHLVSRTVLRKITLVCFGPVFGFWLDLVASRIYVRGGVGGWGKGPALEASCQL
jgi:choline dehydrogenase-like flavoprotein